MSIGKKAEQLRELHHGSELLLLVNAWDAVSARLCEAEGFPAVATGSAGCAAVLGYPDGQHIPRAEMMMLVAAMARAVESFGAGARWYADAPSLSNALDAALKQAGPEVRLLVKGSRFNRLERVVNSLAGDTTAASTH